MQDLLCSIRANSNISRYSLFNSVAEKQVGHCKNREHDTESTVLRGAKFSSGINMDSIRTDYKQAFDNQTI